MENFPKELIEEVRKISKDSHESLQTRNDARSLLSFVDNELIRMEDSELISNELLESYDSQLLNWLTTSLKFFRQLAFFEGEEDVSDKALATEISVLHKQKFGKNIDLLDKLADFHLLRWDRDRIWEGTIKLDMFSSLQTAYIEKISEWAKISRGFFDPRGVTCWKHENGSVTISITHNNEQHYINTSPIHKDDQDQEYDADPQDSSGSIDLGILNQINKLITSTEYQYVSFEGKGDIIFLIFLSEQEIKMLKVNRGWNFENNRP